MGDARKATGGLLGVAASIAVIVAAVAGSAPASGAKGAGDDSRPNVIVLMSDDQTQDSMRYMPRTNELVGGAGATFPTNLANWPVCCPSRATFLTGQYAHNHGVLGNQPPFGGFDRLNQQNTLPVWLQDSGYYTAHVGKFLNGYEDSATGVPAGWTEWHGTKRTYTFYGYQLLEDGQVNTYGSTSEDPDDPAEPGLYSTDLFTDKAVNVINERAPAEQPFFLNVAYLAPHSGGPNPDAPNQSACNGTAKPAPRHLGALANEPLPTPPNFNEADVSDKPAGIASRPQLDAQAITAATRRYRCRGESLLAIDESVERVVNALRDTGELDNTLLMYTSDNGFFHGEHRVQSGKNRVYEEATRIPLMMRGPGVPEGVSVDDISTNADLAPTILDAADADASVPLDGTSLLPFAENPEQLHGRELLIEQQSGADDDEDGSANGVFYSAIRNSRYSYVQNASGEVELYDLEADPYELTNLHANPAYAEAEAALAGRLAGLSTCAGPSCRTKPALRLKLPRSVRENGRSCRRPKDFIAKLRGQGTSSLDRARFAVGAARAGHDDAGPFKKRIQPRLLRSKRKPEIRVSMEMIDGRTFSLQKQVRICR